MKLNSIDANFFGCLLLSLIFPTCITYISGQKVQKLNENETDDKNKIGKTVDPINYRLPNNTKPESYDITLITNIDQNEFNFTGRVTIKLHVLETSNSITIHARQLNIKAVDLATTSGTKTKLNSFTYDNLTEFLVIPTQTELKKGTQYVLTIEYAGELRIGCNGFYRTSYTNSNGGKKWLATTQFESTDARHAFPCYDEPALKATFTIHIEHGESYQAFSNMKETRNAPVNGKVVTDFETTPIMSTYTVAFIVSDLDVREFNTTNDYSIKYRAFAIKDEVDHTLYGLNLGANVIKSLGQYLNISYALPKLDHAVIPGIFCDAMENYGLVTYPKEYFIYDSEVDTVIQQLNVTELVAHEFSHQWFGNLVTHKWWSQIWLSEGITTLFTVIAVDLIHPQWNFFQNFFIAAYLHPSLVFDAESDVNPLTFYVDDSEGIEDRFDDISYNKGASIIRMFMHAMGENTFKKAFNLYLVNNAFGSVDENELFEHFDAAIAEDKALPADYTMDKLLGSWTHQKGFPVLKVTRNYKDGTVTIYQQKYNAVYDKDEPIDSTMWWIPYNFASATNTDANATAPTGWLSNSERQKLIEPSKSNFTWTNDDWLLFNIQQTGFYRVWYDDENYNLISKELNDGDLNKIHPINRAQILDDLHNLICSGHDSAKILCDIMAYLPRETSYVAWVTAERTILYWYQNLQTSNKLADFEDIVAKLVEPLYLKKTLKQTDDEDIFDKLLRATAVSLACKFGVSQCLKDTLAEFQKYINGTKLSPDIQSLAIANGVRSASDDEIAKLWEIFLKSSRVVDRQEIISSFGNIPNDSTVELHFNKTINDPNVSVWERMTFVTSFIENIQNRLLFFIRFLSNNLNSIETTFGSVLDVFNLIAEQIRAKDVETQFSTLLAAAEAKKLISVDDIADLKKTITAAMQWQTEGLKTFENEFFSGKCTGVKNQ